MNINWEREFEAPNYTQSQRAGILQPLGCMHADNQPSCFKAAPLPIDPLLTSGTHQADGKGVRWTELGLGWGVNCTLGLFLNLSWSLDLESGPQLHQGQGTILGNTVNVKMAIRCERDKASRAGLFCLL